MLYAIFHVTIVTGGTTSAYHLQYHLLKFTIGKSHMMIIRCCNKEHLAGVLGGGRLFKQLQSNTMAEQSDLELACYCSWWSELRTEHSKLQTWTPHNVPASKCFVTEGTR